MKTESIEKYQEIFKKDPNSRIFAALADAYRELGLIDQAEKTARHGIQRHTSYASGFVALGRILVVKENWQEAEQVLLKSTTLAPENILAHQLLGKVYLQQQRPKEALKTYKLVLFLNPQSEQAKKAVEKLESLTADEYDDEIFEMKKLSPKETLQQISPNRSMPTTTEGLHKSLERTLSLIDALIVRNEIGRAKSLLEQAKPEFARNPEALHQLESRWQLVEGDLPFEQPTPLQPEMNRERFIRNRQVRRLEAVLHKIKEL